VWALLLALTPSSARAQEAGPTVVIRGMQPDSVYAAGRTVEVTGDLARDLVAAGGTITVLGRVGEDVLAAGGSVLLTGPVGENVRAAGGTVLIADAVGEDVVATGGTVRLAHDARVGGRVWLAGATVEVGGHVRRTLVAAAATVRLAGRVDGDVTLVGRRIEIGPTARIAGNLTYTSPQDAQIDPAAQIRGAVTHRHAETATRIARVIRVVVGLVWVASLLGVMAVGVVLLGLFPRFTRLAASTIAREPWTSLGLGVAVLVVTPIAALVLVLTVIGLPIALMLTALYAVAPLLGYLTAGVFLGDLGTRWAFRRPNASTGWRILSLILALLGLALVRLVPVLGTAIGFLALVMGLGAWTRTAYRYYREGVGPAPVAGRCGS
jgi:cytoskeletal protein CcmA (bactofilin family)